MWNSRWENNNKAVLDRKKVEKIRSLYNRKKELGLNQEKIASMYGVAQTTISRIVRGAGWQEDWY